jgi:hypothetical protein
MKLITLSSLLLIATSAFAQKDEPQQFKPSLPVVPRIEQFTLAASADQSNCPVRFTDIALKTKGRMMLVRSGDAPDGNLALQYQNHSGKTIQSIAINVDLKLKQDMYALDTTSYRLDMVLTGKGLEETLPLNVRGYVYGVNHVTLERVSYTDGTIWSASTQNVCRFENPASSEKIVKLQ